ncbi:MAG TPA: DNA polymerase I, partial [Bacteroidota bacterium]|nr:DNA polymerase I [Bacteroidota bacterium]
VKRERLFLLDGMALAYRAYFSFISHPLINSKGENTSAIYGFVNALMKILNDEKPEHIAVAFDTRHPTFRHVMYERYKATRQKMPEDLSSQMDRMKQVILAFNVPLIELKGYEADDIMGTLARQAEKEGIETYLVTGDKDFMQLISPLIRMYRPGKRGDEWETLDESAVKEKFGVTPEHVIDVLGLTGDASDNVPGVAGIGEKTAIPLVQEYGTIETILASLDKIPQKGVRQKLIDHREDALLSKKLVTIDINVPLSVDISGLRASAPDAKKLLQHFTELEFKSLIRKFSETPEMFGELTDEPVEITASDAHLTDITSDPHEYHLVTAEKDLKKLVEQLKKADLFVFDTETTSTNPLQCELIGISIAIKPKEAWYISVDSNGSDHAIEMKTALKLLEPVFANPKIKKVGQNIKYDMLALASHGMETKNAAFDTMIASYLLRPDGSHGVDALAAEHLQYKMISYDELTGSGKNKKPLREIEPAKVSEYSGQDADITLRLYELLNTKLSEAGLAKLGNDLEFPLVDVLADMEFTGVKIDAKFLQEFSKELEKEIEHRRKEIFRCSGGEFNVNSTQQLGKILFETLKLPTGKKTKTGYSTDIMVLESLRGTHEIIDLLLDYRMLQKLKSTYVDALQTLINPKTGRVHTSYNQTVALTGRLSSSDPNLQNIPIKTELGRSIRKAFIPGGPGMKILAADYSQIELRIMAHVSGDESLREAFVNGEDIHSTTAAKVFGVSTEDITREMRRKAKEVNFGIMYGIGPFGLSTRLHIPQAESKEIIRKYFERFPKVRQYIDDTLSSARKNGYAVTMLGRRRFFPDINSRNANVRANAERQAINMPIQGTAADMIKLAMIDIHRAIAQKKLSAKMLLQVHDEL